MDLNKLDYFFAAAELGNFTQAAERCNIAQTTISKYVVSLESEVGTPLFHRTNKGCSLTVQGELFYTGMKKIHSEYSDVLKMIRSDEKAELRIGVVGEFFNLESLRNFENANQGITLSLSFGSRDMLLDDQRRNRIQAFIIPDVIMPNDLLDNDTKCVDLRSEEGLLTYSKNSIERFNNIPDLIKNLPLITKSADTVYHDHCRKVLSNHFGSSPVDIQVVDTGPRQQLLVSLSQGFAIIPKSELAMGMDLVQESVGEEFIETLQVVYSRRCRSPYLKSFISFIKTNM